MDVEKLKKDVGEGRICVDRLIEIIGALVEKVDAAQQRIEELEAKLGERSSKFEDSFSVEAEEKRQAARGKSKRGKKTPLRRGRISTAEKLQKAQREEDVFPSGLDPASLAVGEWSSRVGRLSHLSRQEKSLRTNRGCHWSE